MGWGHPRHPSHRPEQYSSQKPLISRPGLQADLLGHTALRVVEPMVVAPYFDNNFFSERFRVNARMLLSSSATTTSTAMNQSMPLNSASIGGDLKPLSSRLLQASAGTSKFHSIAFATWNQVTHHSDLRRMTVRSGV